MNGLYPSDARIVQISTNQSVTHYIHKLNKNNIITSIDAEKAFDKIQHPFMIKKKKNSPEVGIEGTYLNIIKALYDKPTTTVSLNGEKLKAESISSKIRNEIGISTITTFIKHSMGCLTHSNQRRIRNKKKLEFPSWLSS